MVLRKPSEKPVRGDGWRSGIQGARRKASTSTQGNAVPRGPQGWGRMGEPGTGWSLSRALGFGQMRAVLTQGCPRSESSAQHVQQGSGPSCSDCMALGSGPRAVHDGTGPIGRRAGRQEEGDWRSCPSPKLSTKNGRFEPWECCVRPSNRGQMGKASGPPRAGVGPQWRLHTRLLCPASM